MSLEEYIIVVYCWVSDNYQELDSRTQFVKQASSFFGVKQALYHTYILFIIENVML